MKRKYTSLIYGIQLKHSVLNAHIVDRTHHKLLVILERVIKLNVSVVVVFLSWES